MLQAMQQSLLQGNANAARLAVQASSQLPMLACYKGEANECS
jgi:hypothetical protein